MPRSRLSSLVPPLLEGHALIALVPCTTDLEWAARAAWDVARAAAISERRVALVDLHFQQPVLHSLAGVELGEGIVDALEYGVSLTKAAREVGRVFFISTGSETAAPDTVLTNERWRKLQRGFLSENALLIVFIGRATLDRLAARPDGVILLGQPGPDVRDADRPILGIVRDRWTPGPEPAVPKDRTIPRRSRLTKIALVGGLLAAAAGGFGGWQLLAKDTPTPTPHDRSPAGPAGPAATPHATAPAHPRPVAPTDARVDTVDWTVQVAAFGTIPAATALADRLRSLGKVVVVTPVASGDGTIWYRVATGFYSSREAALAARENLWSTGAIARGDGDLVRAPYSLELEPGIDVTTLQRLGMPTVRRTPDGPAWAGAFESPEQATLAAARLDHAGVHAALVTRTETTP